LASRYEAHRQGEPQSPPEGTLTLASIVHSLPINIKWDSPIGFVISIVSNTPKPLILSSESWLRPINQQTRW
jgi:hypothetical protein